MTKKQQKAAEQAIRKIAKRDGVSIEYVRKQMQLAMLSGLCSSDPAHKAFWGNVPSRTEIPTPEELITHIAKKLTQK
ncbi:MAG: hypothetical protein H6Q60_652 [Oscillospiraceae bacterium]|nr:hypothetical protein [Oscillospiraceae bacterium]